MKKIVEFLKKNEWIVALAVILVFIGGLYLLHNNVQPQTSLAGEFMSKVKIEEVGECDVTLKEGATAADALDKCAENRKFEVGYKQYDFGRMVNKIGGREADSKNFWALYYNGQMANEGADALKIKGGDVTEWRYEELKW